MKKDIFVPTPKLRVSCVSDTDVTPSLDRKIRSLLTACFVKPGDAMFHQRRYYRENPAMRWFIEKRGVLVAHIALHFKIFQLSSGRLATAAGISEVCVAPTFRGQGLARRLLSHASEFAAKQKLDYLALFGKPGIYGNSGFRHAAGRICYFDVDKKTWVRRRDPHFLVRRAASEKPWPKGLSVLYGPKF